MFPERYVDFELNSKKHELEFEKQINSESFSQVGELELRTEEAKL